MVKKILVTLSVAALLPAHVSLAAKKGPQKGTDQELIEMEDALDREADRQVQKKGNFDGAEFALGVAGLILEMANGRSGRHPGYGRHHRQVTCVARNAAGQSFRAEGYVQYRVEKRAVKICRNLSERRSGRGGDRWGRDDDRYGRRGDRRGRGGNDWGRGGRRGGDRWGRSLADTCDVVWCG